jgi:hypothetical protein
MYTALVNGPYESCRVIATNGNLTLRDLKWKFFNFNLRWQRGNVSSSTKVHAFVEDFFISLKNILR